MSHFGAQQDPPQGSQLQATNKPPTSLRVACSLRSGKVCQNGTLGGAHQSPARATRCSAVLTRVETVTNRGLIACMRTPPPEARAGTHSPPGQTPHAWQSCVPYGNAFPRRRSWTRTAYTNCSRVVAASGSQPRVGWLVTDDTSLIEICRPRVFGPFTSTSAGLHVCWLIF